MKKLFRKFFNWAMNDGSKPMETRSHTPFDSIRGNQNTVFTVIKAQNGTVIQAYEYNREGMAFWVVPEGKSVGNMVDTVLIAERLK